MSTRSRTAAATSASMSISSASNTRSTHTACSTPARCAALSGSGDVRVLYVYCHRLDDSFHAAIRHEALAGLTQAGHTIDLLDLYAEDFDPVLTAQRRRDYHDPARNRANNRAHVDRLMAAEALVVQFPTWSFGPPAMLKGWFDRMFGPGIAMDLSDPAHAKPLLQHI